MTQPTALDIIVGRAVELTRSVHLGCAMLGTLVLLFLAPWWTIPLLIIGLFVSYQISLRVIGHLLAQTLPREVVLEELQLKRIRELNERIAGGLETGPELDALIAAAGLEPLHIPVAYGPVIGKFGDEQLYEWIDAKRGTEGEPQRYFYEGQAVLDQDGCLIVPDREKQYMSINGILYSRT